MTKLTVMFHEFRFTRRNTSQFLWIWNIRFPSKIRLVLWSHFIWFIHESNQFTTDVFFIALAFVYQKRGQRWWMRTCLYAVPYQKMIRKFEMNHEPTKPDKDSTSERTFFSFLRVPMREKVEKKHIRVKRNIMYLILNK